MLNALRPRSWKVWIIGTLLMILAILTKVFHWDERALLWWQEHNTSSDQRAETIWLPGYTAIIQAKPLADLEHAETSDIAYNPATGSLFIVTGKKPLLVEVSLTGDILRRIPITGLSNPEGVVVLGGGHMGIVDERKRTLALFDLDIYTESLGPQDFKFFDLGFADAGNKGFEGVAWDQRQQRLLFSKERDPAALFSLSSDGTNILGTLQGMDEHSHLMNDYSALSIDPRTGHTLVLSDESHLLLELDEEGRPVSFISLIGGLNGLSTSIPQAEGVAIDEAGTVYIVSEPNLFYVFKKSS
ncbi:uncharacterized protein YjiK [Pseudomonas duriflava]|uniref:Uncharacterized protein YjiK n=1 Tax=Pseudomonas duriflava TaxID=459528 RepID=A0A562Q692_9PSED|nr:SdiA-regulated domain-containing protein [Pseudomonas duriflava]TWI52281.1 uncharacterized protein YjiK [Pseudomonas duriflava]